MPFFDVCWCVRGRKDGCWRLAGVCGERCWLCVCVWAGGIVGRGRGWRLSLEQSARLL